MDIYAYLKLDHEHVAQLFSQFENAESVTRRKQIVAMITQELLVHAYSEQETFYKALTQHLDTRDEAMHGKKEHHEIEAQIDSIIHSKYLGASWIKKVKRLKEIVEHHVNEEEGKIFRSAQEVISEKEAYMLKEKMHYLKQQILQRLQRQHKLAA